MINSKNIKNEKNEKEANNSIDLYDPTSLEETSNQNISYSFNPFINHHWKDYESSNNF